MEMTLSIVANVVLSVWDPTHSLELATVAIVPLIVQLVILTVMGTLVMDVKLTLRQILKTVVVVVWSACFQMLMPLVLLVTVQYNRVTLVLGTVMESLPMDVRQT